MPGHVKKSTGPDPDPTEYLFISAEQKMQDATKPYDSKKSCWVPNAKEGFIEGEIQGNKMELITVYAGGETKNWKKDLVNQVNPPKYEKCEDMSNLTYLNDPSVLYNLKSRYVAKLIYTYSGLFCIAVNPYKRYPIYTNRVVKIYQGKRRNEVPPHIFAISDGAYMAMLQGGSNQSMLITGESGAGKTENTKKVLSYFANVGATTTKPKEGEKVKPNLEDQIIQTNPVLEAFGNAKTTRNDNSSRFGKFIRIHFQPNGKLSGADIEVYLLEKARIISQQAAERSYHIFYEMMSDQIKEIKPSCLLSDDIYDYHYVSQGKVTVPSIDDKEDMQFCHDAFTILNFTDQEVRDVYQITAAVMHMGEMAFKQRGREEQAEADGTEVGERVAKLMGVDGADLYRNITKPKIKVGAEFVAKGMNKDQCHYSVGALAKALYDRVFKFLVSKCNQTLETGLKRANFIGVLDIAGFEIFDFNGFEQICINFCNEKLQQFFNHHMFVLEQEEYKKEGINWVFVDFGMDLQACIELFEKKMGILSILEEESMFPKATDKSFTEKLNSNHLGKTPVFIKPKPPKPGCADAHFAIVHYAGTVSYNLTGWLEKNKDPLNDTVVDQLKKASNALTVLIFADHPGQSGGGDAPAKSGRGQKSGSFKTVSSGYREQLNNLMKTLNATEPHFIRCIVPNETKSPGVIDAALIMHQLTCNGVLEGIRICRKGFPNRMIYPDFKHRYKILAAKDMAEAKDEKSAAKLCFDKAGLTEEEYRLGNTKVFFRAGVLGTLEEIRDERLGKMISWVQAWIRGHASRKSYKKLQEQRIALEVVQRSIRKFMKLRNWPWFTLWQKVKPLLNVTRIEDEMKALEEKVAKAQADLENEAKKRKDLEAANLTLLEEKNTLMITVESSKGNVSEYLEKQKKLHSQKVELEGQLDELTGRLEQEERSRTQLSQDKKKTEQQVLNMKNELSGLESTVHEAQQQTADREHQVRVLQDAVSTREELISKVGKEKKHLQDCNQKMAEDLQCVEDKCSHLNTVKGKLEKTMADLELTLNDEKKRRGETDTMRKKVESDLRLTQETVGDLEKTRKDLESAIMRKDSEMAKIAGKLEEEQSTSSRFKRHVKELEVKVEMLDQEVDHERSARVRAESTKAKLIKELSETGDRLEETGAMTSAQIELNKKREGELAMLRMGLDEARIKYESTLSILRKKHSDSVTELTAQIEKLNQIKSRTEREKEELKRAVDNAKTTTDILANDKASAEKTNKQLTQQMNETTFKLDEATRIIGDYVTTKKKLSVENNDLLRQLEDGEAKMGQLNTLKLSLSNQLIEAKKLANEETKGRIAILGKYRNLELDNESLREQLDEDCETKNELLRQMNKTTAEAQMWRAKYESEGLARAEELEAERSKLYARLDEAEAQIGELNVKNLNLEKSKMRISNDMEQVQVEVDRAQSMAIAAEKRQKNFDRIASEWKIKIDELAGELDASQNEVRNYSTELFRVKASYEENMSQMDSLRRENKSLTDEMKNMIEQLNEGGLSNYELQKTVKRVEMEKEELQVALEEAECALEQEENKVLRVHVELGQVRQEIEKKVQQKEEEFECTRKLHQKAVDALQCSMETEAKGKAEALRLNKKMENDIHGLEVALDHTNRANTELQKHIKKIQIEMGDLQQRVDNGQARYGQLREECSATERRANTLSAELEEARGLLENSDRSRRQARDELSNASDKNDKLMTENETLIQTRRQRDSQIIALQADLENMSAQVRSAEEKAKKAMLDAARLADELRAEQDHAHGQEQIRKALDITIRDLQARLKESEEILQKTGRAALAKLESRIRDLEKQLDSENAHHSDTQKNLRKTERQNRDLILQSEDDKKNQSKMQDLVDKMQQKVNAYKRQLDEAEEIAAINLAKFRKAQTELEDYMRQTCVTTTFIRSASVAV